MKHEFLKIQVLDEFLKYVQDEKQKLFTELLQNLNNETLRIRRVRMISQLSDYESKTVKKIFNFCTKEYSDYLRRNYKQEIAAIINRSS